MVILPEGRLARAPGLRPFQTGAFVAAARAAFRSLPIAIRGERVIFRPEHHFPRPGADRRHHRSADQPTGTGWAAAVRLQRAARNVVLRLSAEPDVE